MMVVQLTDEDRNMKDIVQLNNNVPTTTSLAIAEGVKLEHATVIKLIRKYQPQLESKSPLGFEIAVGNRGGSPVEYSILNEFQAMLLISMMRNSDIVVEFKVALVTAFLDMRAYIQDMSTKDSFQVPKTFEEALRLAADQQKELTEANALLNECTPILLNHIHFFESDNCVSTEVLAKSHGMTSTKLNKILREYGIKFKNKDLPIKGFDDYFKLVKVKDGGNKFRDQLKITPVGQTAIGKLLQLKG